MGGFNMRSLVLLWLVLLSLGLAACGEQSPNNKIEKLLINEVYTGQAAGGLQWIELFNNTNEEINLANWKLITTKGEIALSGKVLTKPRFFVLTTSANALIEEAYNLVQDAAANENKNAVKKLSPTMFLETKKILGQLDPDNDIVVLKNGSEVVDQIGWGTFTPELAAQLGLNSDTNLGLTAPKGQNISLGRTPNGPVAPGGAAPGIFTIHSTPSPGLGVPKPEGRYNFFLGTSTDIVAGIGGLLLWLVFILIALIARRFQVLAQQKTYWEWLVAAPIGIFIYDAILVWNYITEKNLTAPLPSWTGFGLLFVSGLACLYVINIFRLVARNILESE